VKRAAKAAAWTLAGVVAAAGALAVWQRGNIEAYIVAKRHTASELEAMVSHNEAATEEILEKLPAALRALTEEERAEVKGGQMGEEEVAQRILERVPPPPGQADGAAAGAAEAGQESEEGGGGADEEEIASLVAQVYVLRGTMEAQLEGVAGRAMAQYAQLPEEERTEGKKRELAAQALKEAAQLEAASDAKMEGILAQLEAALAGSGSEEGVVAEIRAAYESEKSLRKSYFINQYS
jgi:hypothetical protein